MHEKNQLLFPGANDCPLKTCLRKTRNPYERIHTDRDRDGLKEGWNMKEKSGVYFIANTTTWKVYVGSATFFNSRRRTHLRLLRLGQHHSKKLQHSWDKYGPDNFSITLIEFVSDKSQLRDREQYWIDTMNAVKDGYNILPTAGSPANFKLSEETKKKISASKMGRTMSDSARAGLLLANRGRKHTDAQRAQSSALRTGRKPSKSHLEAQIAALRSDEVRKKISIAGKGRVMSEQHIQRIRDALNSPDVQQKLKARSNPRTGAKLTDEQRRNLSERAKQRWADPELRAKYVQARIDTVARSKT